MSLRPSLAALALLLAPSLAAAQPRPAPTPSRLPAGAAATNGSAAASPDLDADDRVWSSLSNGIRESRISAIAADPLEPRTVVAGTARGSLYRSTDGGRSWIQTHRLPLSGGDRAEGDGAGAGGEERDADGLTEEDLQELETLREQVFQDVVDELTELVGEDEAERIAEEEADAAVDERREELIEENEDAAATGELAENEAAPPARLAAVRQIVWDPLFPGLVYAATRDGVWRSGDGGSTWAQLAAGAGEDDRDTIAIAPSAGDPDRMLIATAAGVRVSPDGGLTWSRAEGEAGSTEARTLTVDPDNRSVVAAGTVAGAFVTTDGGQTWRKIWSGVGASGDVRALAFVPRSAVLLAGTGDGLYAITPEGSRAVGVAQFSAPAIRSIVVPAADPRQVYVATSRSVHESSDAGDTFVELYRGLSTPDVLALAEDAASPRSVWAATGLGVFRLQPEGAMSFASGRAFGPTIPEIVRAAEKYALVDRDRLTGYVRGARLATALPRVTASFRWDWDDNRDIDVIPIRDLGGNVVGQERIPTAYDQNANQAFFVTLTWRFDQLLHGTDRARAVSLVRTQTALRTRLLARVSRLARERRDLAARLAATPPGSVDRVPLEIRFQELTGHLDAATGGLLTARSRNPSQKAQPKK